MKSVVFLGLLLGLAASQSLSQPTANFIAGCQNDTMCASQANYCCALMQRTGLTLTNFTNFQSVCVPYEMHGRNMVYGAYNYTWNCTTASSTIATYKSNLGS